MQKIGMALIIILFIGACIQKDRLPNQTTGQVGSKSLDNQPELPKDYYFSQYKNLTDQAKDLLGSPNCHFSSSRLDSLQKEIDTTLSANDISGWNAFYCIGWELNHSIEKDFSLVPFECIQKSSALAMESFHLSKMTLKSSLKNSGASSSVSDRSCVSFVPPSKINKMSYRVQYTRLTDDVIKLLGSNDCRVTEASLLSLKNIVNQNINSKNRFVIQVFNQTGTYLNHIVDENFKELSFGCIHKVSNLTQELLRTGKDGLATDF